MAQYARICLINFGKMFSHPQLSLICSERKGVDASQARPVPLLLLCCQSHPPPHPTVTYILVDICNWYLFNSNHTINLPGWSLKRFRSFVQHYVFYSNMFQWQQQSENTFDAILTHLADSFQIYQQALQQSSFGAMGWDNLFTKLISHTWLVRPKWRELANYIDMQYAEIWSVLLPLFGA